MRLRRLLIEQYGCFAHADLVFATEPGCINLVVAPNGAGKSVLRRAFQDLLFDIPARSPMKFRHGYRGMALHAEAIGADGTAFGFGWVRQGKPSRVTTDPARYAALRRDITPQQIEALFALDTAGLRRGGTDLKGGTTLAGALLAGTGELAPARAVRAAIEARRRANWAPNGRKAPLNAAIIELAGARRRAEAAVQRPQQREAGDRELEALRGAHAAAKADHEAALATTRRLHRIALTRPHLAALAEAAAWFAGHPDAPALPAGLDQGLADARAGVATARATQVAALLALEAATAQAGTIGRDAAATRWAEDLARLPGRLGEAEKAGKDLVARRAERVAALGLVRTALRDIGVAVPEEQAGAAVPPVALLTEARRAILDQAGLSTALELAAARVADADRALQQAEAAPGAAVALPDGLAVLLAEVRADRNPAQHAAEIAAAGRQAEAGLRAESALVPGWTGTAAGLRALTPPAEAVFERLEARRKATLEAARAAAAEHARLAGEMAAAQDGLAALRAQPLPDAAAIAAARAVRDRGMRLVLQRAFASADAAAERDYAGAEPVALVYQRQVLEADALSDRRMAELDRVQQAERLGGQIAALGPALATAAASGAAAALALAERGWAAACAPLGLAADATGADVRGLLAARLRVIEALRAAEVAADAAAGLAGAHASWAGRLAALLGADGSLPALLALGDARVAAARLAEREAARHQAQLEAGRLERIEAAGLLAAATVAFGRWEARWAGIRARLGRPAGEPVEATAAVLERVATLDEHDRAARALGERIEAMQVDLDGFAGFVDRLARDMSEPGGEPGGDPLAMARALVRRAGEAAAQAAAWQQAQGTLGQARATLFRAEAGLGAAQDALGAVVAAAGAATPEEADLRIAGARDHARMTRLRDQAAAGLRADGDAMSRDTLVAEAERVPAETMGAARDAAEAAAVAAGARAEAAAVGMDQLGAMLAAEAGATLAVEARAEYQAASTQFGRRLEEQLVLQVAGGLLAQAMAAVEQGLGDSGLDRVSAAFAAVTGGSHAVVMADDGLDGPWPGGSLQDGVLQDGSLQDGPLQDGPVRDGALPEGALLYVREHAYPGERKALDELSEGTRDQLYLALRMVALRDHCLTAEPLPFIADDILQTFDDDRALTALRSLVALSAEVQVIVLTHHRHLAELAGELPPGCARVLRL